MTRPHPDDLKAVETVELKAVMYGGEWITVPYVLIRSPSGLSDRPIQAAAAPVLGKEVTK